MREKQAEFQTWNEREENVYAKLEKCKMNRRAADVLKRFEDERDREKKANREVLEEDNEERPRYCLHSLS